ncbi:MAG: pentapeptide repeat-containing protein [Clostridiales bacterium]|nr:pentapeptide repeat-containing protein [Clostridiales bacterium]
MRKRRQELKKTEWFQRWRIGKFRKEITHLKKTKKPSNTHPVIDGLYDFRCANLRKAKLEGGTLNKCCFNEAEMYQIYMPKADLSNSEFIDADLAYAILRKTNLSNSLFTNTKLRRADLSHADLSSSNLVGADLSDANFYKTNLEGVDLGQANLINAKALSEISGRPKSVQGVRIDFETLKELENTEIGKLLRNKGDVVNKDYEYDVAISFAGENRNVAEELSGIFSQRRLRVFYDEYYKADLWGKNLYDHLSDVYKNKAIFCVVLVSTHYAEKQWTNLERQAAQARAFEENREYILPIRLDTTDIKGFLPTMCYLDYNKETPLSIARMLHDKVKKYNKQRHQ